MSARARPQGRAPGAAPGPSARDGMTLVEVIVAMLILTAVILALGAFTTRFSQANSQAHLIIAANELASQRLDAARQQATYSSIGLLNATDTVKADFQTFTRRTSVLQVGGGVKDSLDYKLITVVVTHPSWKTSGRSVTKTTAVAAF